jgi:hypothetical protein
MNEAPHHALRADQLAPTPAIRIERDGGFMCWACPPRDQVKDAKETFAIYFDGEEMPDVQVCDRHLETLRHAVVVAQQGHEVAER